MNPTPEKPNGASPLIDPAIWRGMSKGERALWWEWREAHPADAWRPLVDAITRTGYRFPPTEPETAMLWPIVDAGPNRTAEWFREGAKPQGSLRMQPSWAMVLRHVLTAWDELRDGIPEDDDQPNVALLRAEDDAKAVLRRIGWYRSG